MSETTIYGQLSMERKRLQEEGRAPEWMTTAGWQMFKEKYLYQASDPKEQYMRIAATAAAHTKDPNLYRKKFFELMWNGWLSLSTPVLANMGTTRGLPVSCAGNYVGDSIDEIYKGKHETAMLTKMGFGTASYLGDIRPRGTDISVGGKSEGILPIIQGMHQDMSYVAQGSARRGSWAGYVPMDHGDFPEVCAYLEQQPDGNNIGWNASDEFIERLAEGNADAVSRFGDAMRTKKLTGRGYYFFPDKANRQRPQWYKDQELDIKAPQLCVVPETLILTDKGYVPIVEVVDQNVNVWNGREWSEVIPRKTGRDAKIIKVKTDSGFEVECTEYHRFIVVDLKHNKPVERIVEAKDLKEGDRLVKLETPVIEGDKVLEKAYQNGFYSGDGCEVQGEARVYLYGDKRELISEFPERRKEFNQDKFNRDYFVVDGLQKKFFVPSAEYTVESRINWLTGLLDADGCVTRSPNGSEQIQLVSIEPEFLRELQLMLQTLGVKSKIKPAKKAGEYLMPANDGTGGNKMYKCSKSERILISTEGVRTLLSLGMDCKRLILTGACKGGFTRYIKIDSISDEGRVSDTYCFTEPKLNRGVFNGLLTRNCNEVLLHNDKDHTYTCVLSSMVASRYDEWKDTDAVQTAIIFLDAVVQEFIEKAKNISGLEKAVRFTKKGRALGLGVCGFHTYLQQHMIPYESLKASMWNTELFAHMRSEAEIASKQLAKWWGEPEWCKGYGRANTHLLAVAPTKSTALIMGGISEGINPDVAYVFTQRTPAGEVDRVNPVLLQLMKDKGVYTKENVKEVRRAMGSVQGVDWLTPEEKKVFKTAFELDQFRVLEMGAVRGHYLDQWQSLNLFFKGDADESYINDVHVKAFLDERILGLYYMTSMAVAQASDDDKAVTVDQPEECEACQ